MLTKQEKRIINMAKARKVRLANLANKGKSTYLNRKGLFTRSCIERLTISEIAKLCKTSYEEIWDAHKKLKIPIIIMIGRENWHRWVLEHRDELLR